MELQTLYGGLKSREHPSSDVFLLGQARPAADLDQIIPDGLSETYSSSQPSNKLFVPNGLLAGKTRNDSVLESEDQDMDHESNETFVPNGLLSESNSGKPSTQEDNFPDVSDILRPYVKDKSSPSTSSSSSPFEISPSIRATTFNGKTIRIKRRSRTNTSRTDNASSLQRSSKLLDVPIHRLMDQLSAATATKLFLGDRLSNETATVPTSVGVPQQAKGKAVDRLWVDRYRPQKYSDLLGDERVHRETMAWVKEWDWCVFGKNKKGKKRAKDDDYKEEYQDEYHRPREKILLLSGPPGLGKTTLAHIVAKQAGYNVFEINASDARSGQVVDDRIRPALESGSAVGASKPSLVVIDEIDGATGAGDNASGFVQKLVELTFDKPRKKRGKRDQNAKRPLLRPIICICNDLYASSLAKLRPHTRIVRFNRPSDVLIVRRLRDICEKEGMNAETRALSALVGVAQGDMRGCLNTLQFIRARNQEVTETTIRTATKGMKEADSSLTSILTGLFTPMSKKKVKELGYTDEEENKYVYRLSREVDGSGALDKVAMGCFEHYANLRRHDATFARYEKANEWLATYDRFSGTMRSEREYALLPYLSYALVPFYPLFNDSGGPKVERPKADWENYQKTKTNEEIYHSLARCLRTACSRKAGDYRHLCSDQILELEFAPYINRIISPPLRPVNSQVIRADEKAVLTHLVDVMVSLDLRFVQEKAEDGQRMYRVEPPVDVFVTYDGKRAADIAVSRYAVRHLVAAEIEAKSIAHQAEAVEKSRSVGKAYDLEGDRIEDEGAAVAEEGSLLRAAQLSSSGPVSKKARVEEIDIADRPPTDFFGRPIDVLSAAAGKGKAPAKTKANTKYRVAYRYKEGNSAAVRKPVKVNTFL